MTNSEIRAKARQSLGGNIFANSWMLALVVMLIATIITSVTGSVVPLIGSLLIYGPLMVGVAGYFLAQARQEKTPSLENMFNGFSDFGNNFVLGLLMYLFIFLWSLLFIIPGIVKSYAYSMAFYLKHDHPEYTWRECLDESQRIMNGKKGQLFLLDLSFIGWWILGALCCGIGTLWVAPYAEAARVNFYEAIKEN
jgi:uncharacterized membrane protein